MESTTGTPQSPFGFIGGQDYQEDGDSGLKLLGHRYYDPSTGRFLTRDRAENSRNWFNYCSNNPLNKIDPTGFYTWWSFQKWLVTDDGYANDDTYDGGLNNLWGSDTTDPNGHPVRIGGFPSVMNPPNTGQTYNGTIHFRDEPSYAKYLADDHWQHHEEGHIVQGQQGPDILFLALWVDGAIDGGIVQIWSPPSHEGPWGHDYNPLEDDAEAYANILDGRGNNGYH